MKANLTVTNSNGQTSGIGRLLRDDREVVGLYASVFFYAFLSGMWFLSMPFVIKRFSGSDLEVGLCLGLFSASYVAALLVSMFCKNKINTFNPKRIIQLGLGITVVTMIVAYWVVVIAEGNFGDHTVILILTILMMIQGVVTVMLWPPMVGWLSANHEGPLLNRRLAIFNICWSVASIVSPFAGGFLVSRSSTLPFLCCIVMGIVASIMVSFSDKPGRTESVANNEKPATYSESMKLLRHQFTWMSRIAILTCFACIGIVRSQLAILFKYELGFSEFSFGIAAMILGAFSFLVFYAAGKTEAWHCKFSSFFLAQAAVVLGMVIILFSTELWQFFLALGLTGMGSAFLYSSHLYYSLSEAKGRTNIMALHEAILGIAILTGSIAGGYLSNDHGRYSPYWFGFAMVIAGVLIQGAILFSFRANCKKYELCNEG